MEENNTNNPIYLFDLDGTLVIEDRPVPYAPEFIRFLNENGRDFYIVTNGTALTPEQILKKLESIDIRVNKRNIITTAEIMNNYLLDNYIGKEIFVVGAEWLKKFFKESGLLLSENKPEAVVVSYDKNISFNDVEKCIRFIVEGANFISTNDDFYIPGEKQYFPHTGLINSVITSVTKKKPHIIGKPSLYFFKEVQKRAPTRQNNYCIVGDNVLTDIAFGKNCNIPSFLVMTGVTQKEEIEKSLIKPDKIIKTLMDLFEMEN
jgi:HAD superfamily hydrolase (TIGR01457 family)